MSSTSINDINSHDLPTYTPGGFKQAVVQHFTQNADKYLIALMVILALAATGLCVAGGRGLAQVLDISFGEALSLFIGGVVAALLAAVAGVILAKRGTI
jgi:hypothetical protein